MTRNFLWMAAGNIAYALAQGGQLIVLARLGSPGVVGVFSLGLAIATPAVVLSQLRLQDVIATDAAREHRFSEYLTLTAVTSALALIVAWGVAIALGYGGEAVSVTGLLAISKVVESFSFLLYGVQQRRERMSRVGLSLVARGLLGVGGLSAGFILGGYRLPWAVVGLVAANAVVMVALDIPQAWSTLRDEPGAAPSPIRPVKIMRLALAVFPLGLMAVLVSVTTSIPRVMLERVAGEGDLGVFAALAYLVVASTVVARALAQAAAPRLAQSHLAGDVVRFRRLLVRLVMIAGAMGVAGVVLAAGVGRPVLEFLYGEEYGRHVEILILVAVYGALMFVALPLTHAMIAARRLAQQLAVFGAVVAAAVGFGALLIPAYEMAGAAWTMIAAGTVRVTGSWLVLCSVLRSPPAGGLEEASVMPESAVPPAPSDL